MTFRFPSIRGASLATTTIVLSLLAGCAGRSLNVTPVEDWSDNRGVAVTAPSSPAQPPQQLYTVKRGDTLTAIAKQYNTTPANVAAWNNLSPSARLLPDQVLRVSAPPPPAPVDNGPSGATTSPIGNETVEQRPLGVPSSGSSGSSSAAAASSGVPLKTGPSGSKRPYSDAAFAEMSKPDVGDAPTPAVTAAPAPAPAATSAPAAAPGAAIVWAWPATGKPAQPFGDGKSKGIDIAGKAGDPVLAAADGKVTFAGTGVRGYGNFVIVRHSPDLLSVYARNRANLVKEGDLVTRGQKIAEMGNADTGGTGLHFEIRSDSKPVDPLKYLPER
jgi:lipoprotein NlpD